MNAEPSLRHPFDLFPREKLALLVIGFAFLGWLGWVAYAKSSRREVVAPGERISFRLDINRATAAELEELPMIGSVRAASIVEFRATQGPFHSVDDLRKVTDISEKVIEAIRPFVAEPQEQQ
jgi:competence ComEA-like helix-hairpin-helix protein